jgi:hypothetical protein
LIVFLASGAVLIGISIPLILGRVGPNRWYGFRVRRTLQDARVWYAVNAYSARWLLGVGAAEVIAATVLYLVPDLDVAAYALIVGGVTVAALILGLIQSFRCLHRITKEKEPAAG